MSHKSYYEKGRDVELWWENRQKTWLENLKKSPLYEKLKTEFTLESLDGGLERLAERRTNAYRYGTAKLLNRQREKYKLMPEAFSLIKQVQAKKLFNLGMLWRSEQVKIPGVWHTWQLYKIEACHWNTRFVPAFSTEDLAFLKHLMKDEVFVNCREKWKRGHTIDSNEYVRHYQNLRKGEDFKDYYPLLYERYDEWFETTHLLQLTDIRQQKLDYLAEVYYQLNKTEPAVNVEDPEAGKEYRIPWAESESEYFRKEEPAHLQRLYEAHDLFFPDGNTFDEHEYITAFNNLVKTENPGYPDGSVPWLEATVFEGRRILYSKVYDILDDAYAEYHQNLANGIPMDMKNQYEDPTELHHEFLDEFVAARQHLGLSTNPEDL